MLGETYSNENGAIKISDVFSKVFLWMFMGLFATGLISWFTYSSGLIENMLTGNSFALILIVELVVVILFSLLFRKLSPSAVAVLFFIYAVVNGITLGTIYYVYELTSILYVLFASAALFGVFAFMGNVLKKDISKIGNILMGVLIVALIISVINIFVGNSMIDIAIDWVVLLVFFGVTAWDMQQIKLMVSSTTGEMQEKLHIYGAMMLYLDFINIFLRLLSIFGKRND